MKRNVVLTVTSLLVILLLTVHLAQDSVRFKDPEVGVGYLVTIGVLAVIMYGALILVGRRSGTVLMLIGSLGGMAMPVVHIRGLGGTSGDLFFVWTLIALGVTGTFSLLLSARELWGLRRAT